MLSRPNCVGLGLATLLSCSALAAQAAPAKTLASITVGKATFERRLLGNGLHAVAVRDDGKGVSVFMVIGAGKRHETPDTTGLAHLTEHAMYTGTPTTKLGGHDRRIRAWGGESNAFTREDYTLFYDHELPVKHLDAALAMEADRLRNLKFDPKGFEFERERLRVEEQHTFRPTDGRREQLEAAVYKVHGYGAGVCDKNGHTRAPGLDVDTVHAFYDRYYHPDNTAVVVVGQIEPATALDAIEGAFGKTPRGPERPAVAVEPPIEVGHKVNLPVDLPRDRVEFVWLVPELGHPDRPALDVLARLLSRRHAADGSPIAATMGDRVDQELFRVAANGPTATDELTTLLDSVREAKLDPKEVAEVASLLSDDFSSLPLRARPYFSLAGTFGVYELLGHVDALAGYEKAVSAVDAPKLVATAMSHLDAPRGVTVVFKSSNATPKPLPNNPHALQTAAEEAVESGDLDRAIAAYTRLLKAKPNRMFKVIYLSSRGQVRVQQSDYQGAIDDYEQALEVIDYPAVRDLLREARELEANRNKPTSRPGGSKPPAKKPTPTSKPNGRGKH